MQNHCSPLLPLNYDLPYKYGITRETSFVSDYWRNLLTFQIADKGVNENLKCMHASHMVLWLFGLDFKDTY